MKRAVFLFACFVAFVTDSLAQSKFAGEKGVSSVGVIAGYAIDNETIVIGADYRYNIEDRIRLAPSILHVFRNDNYRYFNYAANLWYFNADVHYLARITDKITMYPIGGLGISVWNFKYGLPGNMEGILGLDTESESKARVGLNLGFGVEMRLTQDIIAGAEFRYNLTSRHYRQAMIVGRVAYYF